MTRVLVFAALLLGIAQTPIEPPVFPPGQFCAHAEHGQNPAHPCACQRECVPSTDEDGHETVTVREDAKCKQYCHADHCHCIPKNCP